MAYKKLIKVSNVCQLLDKSNFPATKTINGVTFTNNGDGTFTVNGTASVNTYFNIQNIGINRVKSGITLYLNSNIIRAIRNNVLFEYSSYSNINGWVYFYIPKGGVCENLVAKPQLFDLTEMYGAGHEPTTVAQFRQDFPNDLYDYSPRCWLTSYKRVILMGEGNYLTTYQRNLTCKTKNLFDIPLTMGYPSDTTQINTTPRTFTVGTYLRGITRNNYYVPSNVDCTIDKNKIKITVHASGFGISIPFLLPVGNTYTVSCKADNNFYPAIGISYYKEDGTIISYTESEVITNNPVKSFTVPENTYYTLILFYGRTDNNYTFSNIQLELGSTATDYVPYGHL